MRSKLYAIRFGGVDNFMSLFIEYPEIITFFVLHKMCNVKYVISHEAL